MISTVGDMLEEIDALAAVIAARAMVENDHRTFFGDARATLLVSLDTIQNEIVRVVAMMSKDCATALSPPSGARPSADLPRGEPKDPKDPKDPQGSKDSALEPNPKPGFKFRFADINLAPTDSFLDSPSTSSPPPDDRGWGIWMMGSDLHEGGTWWWPDAMRWEGNEVQARAAAYAANLATSKRGRAFEARRFPLPSEPRPAQPEDPVYKHVPGEGVYHMVAPEKSPYPDLFRKHSEELEELRKLAASQAERIKSAESTIAGVPGRIQEALMQGYSTGGSDTRSVFARTLEFNSNDLDPLLDEVRRLKRFEERAIHERIKTPAPSDLSESGSTFISNDPYDATRPQNEFVVSVAINGEGPLYVKHGDAVYTNRLVQDGNRKTIRRLVHRFVVTTEESPPEPSGGSAPPSTVVDAVRDCVAAPSRTAEASLPASSAARSDAEGAR